MSISWMMPLKCLENSSGFTSRFYSGKPRSVRAGAPDAASQLAGLSFAVLLVDDTFVIAEANPAAEELLGRSARRLVGENLSRVLRVADERVEEGLRAPDAELIARAIAIGPMHRERCVDLTSSPLDNHPGWRVVTLSDIGRMESNSDETRAELRAPAVLAHEIKNPLAAIRGAGQLLARRVDAHDRPLALLISGEVDRIARLIDRMQQLGAQANISSGPCNLHQAIRNAITTVRAGRPEAVSLVEEFDPSLPPVEADQDSLEQVMINLIANAFDASRGLEEPRIVIRTRFVSGAMPSAISLGKTTRLPVEITVTNIGPEIDPDLRDHIFEPFVSGKPGGQGLGLALVRKLLRDMGGRIGHDRDERAGLTRFRINLPLANREKD